MHMVFLFAGFLFGKFGTGIWVIQWFMMYHGMIKDKKAIEKARWARCIILFAIFTCLFLVTVKVL